MNLRSIGNKRRFIIARIKKAIEPHLWESGYRTGPIDHSRPLKVWAPRRPDGKVDFDKTFKIGGYLVDEIEGLTEHGIIDGSGGGCITNTDFECLPLEDLVRLERWVNKMFPGRSAA